MQEQQIKDRSFKKGLKGSEWQRKRSHAVDTRFQKDAFKMSSKWKQKQKFKEGQEHGANQRSEAAFSYRESSSAFGSPRTQEPQDRISAADHLGDKTMLLEQTATGGWGATTLLIVFEGHSTGGLLKHMTVDVTGPSEELTIYSIVSMT